MGLREHIAALRRARTLAERGATPIVRRSLQKLGRQYYASAPTGWDGYRLNWTGRLKREWTRGTILTKATGPGKYRAKLATPYANLIEKVYHVTVVDEDDLAKLVEEALHNEIEAQF